MPLIATGLTHVPAPILHPPLPAFAPETRKWQGIASIERAPGGRLWATWYTGGSGEEPGNYVVLATSGDDGETWTDPALVVAPPSPARAFDSALWVDPTGRLWFFWSQAADHHVDGRVGVWAMTTDAPDDAAPAWSEPRRLCNGIMMNKPTVLKDGTWLLPAAVWECAGPKLPETAAERFSNVIASTDNGKTWARRGGADVPNRHFDEHMVVEREDGSLWMLVRCSDGIGESVSTDGGVTWSPGQFSGIPGPSSRFHIRRLPSGKLLLITHHFQGEKATRDPQARSHLTAYLSGDDGRTWTGELILDERGGISYPDAGIAPDGTVYAIYDRERGDQYAPGDAREILMAVFTEEDVMRGDFVSPGARQRVIVSKVPETALSTWRQRREEG